MYVCMHLCISVCMSVYVFKSQRNDTERGRPVTLVASPVIASIMHAGIYLKINCIHYSRISVPCSPLCRPGD